MGSVRRTLFAGLVATLSALGVLTSTAVADTGSTAPTIESVSVLGITEHDATLEAQVDPGGLATTYEIWLSSPVCQDVPPDPRRYVSECASISDQRVGLGQIVAGDSERTVSVDLSGLRSGYSYGYWLVATNSQGKTETNQIPGQTFKTLPTPPPVTDETASNVTEHGATLEGQVNPEGEWSFETTYVFEYGTSTSYGASAPIPSGAFDSEACKGEETLPCGISTPQLVSESLTGLESGRTYHYRIVATNSLGTSHGEDATFTTAPSITSGTTQSGGSPASTGLQGGSEALSSARLLVPPLGGVVKPTLLTRRQKLEKVLQLCEKLPSKHRSACRRQADEKYATAAKKVDAKRDKL